MNFILQLEELPEMWRVEVYIKKTPHFSGKSRVLGVISREPLKIETYGLNRLKGHESQNISALFHTSICNSFPDIHKNMIFEEIVISQKVLIGFQIFKVHVTQLIYRYHLV